MSNAFNDFFTRIGPDLDKEIPIHKGVKDPSFYLKSRVHNSFFISPTDPLEILNIIKDLDDNKSSGPCPIPTKLLKIVGNCIALPLSEICNLSFSQGIFPDANKIAKIIKVKVGKIG